MYGTVFGWGRRLPPIVRAALVLVALAALLGGIACERQVSSDKMTVVTTIFPLADFVKNVAGDKVEVVTLLRSGDSPHTYEPSSRDMKAVARATLLVVNGAGLDFWVEKLKSAASDNLVVVDTSVVLAEEGLLLSGDEHEHEHEHEADDHGGTNPHFWLDPVLAQKQVEAIASALVTADPDNKDFYLENAADYIAQLQSLDGEIRTATMDFSPREFIAYHASWTYFAKRYGLVEAAVMAPSHGQEPDIKHAIDVAREFHVKAIFAEPQFTTSVKSAETVAAETQAKVLVLDPIGGTGLKGRDSYIALMRYNVGKMGEAMK
jgi:zinc transport system substrate-binding protein